MLDLGLFEISDTDPSGRWERKLLKRILPKNFPSVRKAWEQSTDAGK